MPRVPTLPAPRSALLEREKALLAASTSLRLIAIGGLMLAELLWLTVQFDTSSLALDESPWGGILRWGPQALQFLIAMLATACLASRHRLQQHWQTLVSAAAQPSDWPARLAFQGICFGLLLWTSTWLYAGPALPDSVRNMVVLEWLLLAGATAVSGALAIASASSWFKILRSEWLSLSAGALVALVSIGLTQSVQSFWEPLADLNLAIVALLLSLCFPSVVVENSTRLVGTPTFCVDIAPQCSGYEGIGLMLVFLTVFLLLFRQRLRFPQAWLLWPLGVLLIWLCNSVRIALLIVVGTLISPAIALGGFHSQAGWIFFNLVALGLAATALRIPFFSRDVAARPARPSTSADAWLVPFLILTGLHLMTTAWSAGFDWLYPLKIAGTGLALAVFARGLLQHPTSPVTAERDASGSWTAIAYGVLVFLFWVPLVATGTASAESTLPLELRELPWTISFGWLSARVLGSTLVIPVAEELAFRGYLMRRLSTRNFSALPYAAASWSGVLGSSLLFGLIHQNVLAAILAGLVYAQAARQRNRLSDAVLAHAVTNGMICIAVLAGNCWWLW